MPKRLKPKHEPDSLKGWQQIAAFLGQPVSVAQRWGESWMPVEKRGRESAGEPVQIATESADLAADLRRGLSYVRKHASKGKQKRAA